VRLWAVLFALVSCRPAVNAETLGDGTVAIQCERDMAGCRARAQSACPGGFDLADAQGYTDVESTPDGRLRSTYVGEMFVRCRGAVDPDALGYRDCMADASCETGDRCVWASDEGGDVGRCQRGR
jgi:hypothetical protein